MGYFRLFQAIIKSGIKHNDNLNIHYLCDLFGISDMFGANEEAINKLKERYEAEMRKVTKRGLTKKLDKEVSRIVRSRGYCVKCKRTENLQCCHIISRSHMATRWHFDNLLCLCPNCHINFAHKNPLLFSEFCESYLGKERYAQLITIGTIVKKYTLEEMQELLLTLTPTITKER